MKKGVIQEGKDPLEAVNTCIGTFCTEIDTAPYYCLAVDYHMHLS